jgi:hypothetical protein
VAAHVVAPFWAHVPFQGDETMTNINWPNTPCPDKLEWAKRCCTELLRQDSLIPDRDALGLADDMSTSKHWRHQEPEAAARELFGPSKTYTAW